MTPLTTRSDLTDVAARHAPTRACATAMQEQRATVLGGFTPAGCLPCWIVHVRSRRGNEWFIAVECDDVNLRYRVKQLDPGDVPYAAWIGRSNGKRPLIDGDVPKLMAFKRMRAKYASATKTELRSQARAADPDEYEQG